MQSAKMETKLEYVRPIVLISLLNASDVISTSAVGDGNLESDGWT